MIPAKVMTEGQPKPTGSRRALTRVVVSGVVAVIVALATVHYMPKPLPEVSRKELIKEVQAGQVHEVIVVDGEVLTGESSQRGPFRVVLRKNDDLVEELMAMDVDVKFEKEPDLIP
jgi:hypothetical protein